MVRLALSTLLFYGLHSVLAMERIKGWVGHSPVIARWYRLFYSLSSLALVVLVAFRYTHVPALRAFPSTPLPTILGWLLVWSGTALISVALRQTGLWSFIGLRPDRVTGLLRNGPYRWVRHPIYTGVISMALGWCLLCPTLPTALVCLITLLYLPFGIRHEESRLVQQFGEAYRNYQHEVPALWPRF
ncbi:MAG: isoprenylcysteine carboxylmethyltransferase family protein [Flavobacteriales bacterium]|nr:isoprenylcysteine carboxylmethyltransferase family protein [Flavobacteriales bacterium]